MKCRQGNMGFAVVRSGDYLSVVLWSYGLWREGRAG